MALTLLRSIGLRVLTNASNPLNQSFTQTKLPALTQGAGAVQITPVRWRTRVRSKKKKGQFPPDFCKGKPIQEWWEWDGFGPYKARNHQYPTNWTLRDVQRRRILKEHAEERNKVAALFRNDILPQELKDLAREQIHKVPRDSAITRVNRRCAITGRGRGIFHQFRVSRMVFRAEADYNKLSGVQRAKWIKSIDIDP